MIVLYLSLLGLVTFVVATVVLGAALRRQPSRARAERTSRVMHLLFFVALTWPPMLVFIEPGITRLDGLLGIPSLQPISVFRVVGLLLALPGAYYFVMSNRLLRSRGQGANAFRLTRLVVVQDVYERTRNPMSLGSYLLGAAFGLLTGSTLFTLWMVAAIVPAHLFFLKYFEELELRLRLGDSYEVYRLATPFLIPAWRRPARRGPVRP